MNKLVALSLAIGGVGGIMTWIYTSTPLTLSIPISFIAWACFVAAGGNNKALSSTITAWLWGAVVAWLTALILIPNLGGLPAGLGVPATIFLSVFVLVYGTKVKAFSLAPGAVYGYAAFYKKDFSLHLMDPVGVTVEQWDIKGAFITDADFGGLDYTSGEPVEISITVRPDECILRY